MAIMLAPFDASRDFVTQTSFRAGGRIWLRREPFDKSFVNQRVLGQLYEQRCIAYAEKRPRAARPPTPTPAPIKPVVRLGELLGGFVDTIKAHISKNSEGATGAEVSARDDTDSGLTKSPISEEAAAAPVPEAASTDSTTVDAETKSEAAASEEAAAPAGDAETAATVDERDAKIDKLMIDHSHAQLLERAADMPGMSKRTPKAEVAAALVDAGRHE